MPFKVLEGLPRGAKIIQSSFQINFPASFPCYPYAHPSLGNMVKKFPCTWVWESKNVRVFGPTIAMADGKNQLLAQATIEWGRKANENWVFRRCRLPPTEKLRGKSLIMASTGGDTYFHWMTDVMPKYFLAQKAGYSLKDFDHFIVNGTKKPFQKESLARLGIPLDKCRTFAAKEKNYLAECAVLPSLQGRSGVVSPRTVQQIRATFPVLRVSKKQGSKIFIGRSGAADRKLLHEKAIKSFLGSRGFQIFEPANFSISEQAELFFSADLVVVAHGAAATNLIFCRPGTWVIELFSPEYVNPCYRDLSASAGLRHASLIGSGKDWKIETRNINTNALITVSLGQIKELLNELGTTGQSTSRTAACRKKPR